MSLDYSFYWRIKNPSPSDDSQYPRSRALIGSEPQSGDSQLSIATPPLTNLRLEVIEEGWGFVPTHSLAYWFSGGTAFEAQEEWRALIKRDCLDFVCENRCDAVLLFNHESLVMQCRAGDIVVYEMWGWDGILPREGCDDVVILREDPPVH